MGALPGAVDGLKHSALGVGNDTMGARVVVAPSGAIAFVVDGDIFVGAKVPPKLLSFAGG